MLGELTDVLLTNIAGANWTANYDYHKDGDLDDQTINSTPTDFSYNGDLLTSVGGNTLNWDENGNLENSLMVTSTNWNWSNKLRFADVGYDYIGCTYAPSGEMVFKVTYKHDTQQTTTRRKYIVDVTGKYPVVLLELDPDNSYAIVKTYIQAKGQTLMQRDGSQAADDDRYFYLHDRLGSVRALIDSRTDHQGEVVNCYVYDPFGNALDTSGETQENIVNPFRLANYQWDATIGQYYCNARWYDPELARFTGRDPILGNFQEPLTLHAYLYCMNDPINHTDPTGRMADGGTSVGTYIQVNRARFAISAGATMAYVLVYVTTKYWTEVYFAIEAAKNIRHHPSRGHRKKSDPKKKDRFKKKQDKKRKDMDDKEKAKRDYWDSLSEEQRNMLRRTPTNPDYKPGM